MCSPSSGIGVTVNCNTNCNRWCPRVLRVFCCCFGCTDQVEASDCDKRVAQAVSEALYESEKLHNQDSKNAKTETI